MKKIVIILAFFMVSSLSFLQAGEAKGYAAALGVYALNLGMINHKTGSLDLADFGIAMFSAGLATDYLMFPPKTETECKMNIGMQVAAGGLMLGRIWYKIANRPRPPVVAPRRLITEVEEIYDCGKARCPNGYSA